MLATHYSTAPIAWRRAELGVESRPWVTLNNCEYIAANDNDGDSFSVRSGTNEFTLRLYYVDAPETMLTYPERVR